MMGRFHFSLAGLAGGIALLCVHLAAWMSRSAIAAAMSSCLLYGLTGIALCGAIVCRDHRRPFWTGVAIFGLAFCFYGERDSEASNPWRYGFYYSAQPPSSNDEIDSLLDWIEVHVGTSFRVGDRVSAIWQSGGWFLATITQDHGDGTFDVKWDDGSPIQRTQLSQMRALAYRSRTAGRSLLGTLFALGGGVACAMMFGVRPEKNIPPTPAAKNDATASNAAHPPTQTKK